MDLVLTLISLPAICDLRASRGGFEGGGRSIIRVVGTPVAVVNLAFFFMQDVLIESYIKSVIFISCKFIIATRARMTPIISMIGDFAHLRSRHSIHIRRRKTQLSQRRSERCLSLPAYHSRQNYNRV